MKKVKSKFNGPLLSKAISIFTFAIVGLMLLLSTRAASPNVNLQAEAGSEASPVSQFDDSGASEGKAITFNGTNTPADCTNTSIKPAGYGQPSGTSGVWNQVFCDEFEGTTLNTANWTKGWNGGTSPVQDQELACYYPEQVRVENGVLRLVAERKDSTCSKGTNPHPYTSGAVDSKGKKSYAYGYFEARIWLDAASDGSVANWPAWWTDGTNWPTDGEMDIMEGLSGNTNATWHGPLKCGDGSGNPGCGYNFGRGGHRTGWHTFAAEWKPGEVTSYYDGVRLGNYASSTNITSAKQFLILGMQMSPEGQYGGKIKAPTEMKIEYVRVWQR